MHQDGLDTIAVQQATGCWLGVEVGATPCHTRVYGGHVQQIQTHIELYLGTPVPSINQRQER